jgi:hypothetical protein
MKHSSKNKPVVTPRVARRRALERLRNEALQQRIKDAKRHHGDQLRCYSGWMLDSDVNVLIRKMEMERLSMTPRQVRDVVDSEWMKVAGNVIVQAALLVSYCTHEELLELKKRAKNKSRRVSRR